MASLPIDAVLDEVRAAVRGGGRLVVAAAPGSGKTTRVPPAVAEVVDGVVLVLEPRRIAARAMAGYLAAGRGEKVGDTIGLRTRDERRVGPRTRIEFITEGVLTRRLQRDPGLEGVAAVIFDEFHERSLPADLGLALTLDAAEQLRPDLAIVVMSATLDSAATAALLGGATVIEAPGRAFPVQTQHRPFAATVALEAATAEVVAEALRDTTGDVLVFLPGAAEIRRTQRRIDSAVSAARRQALDVVALHGQLSAAEQDRALAPARTGRRKVVLATNVAETSLTVRGVRTVIDSGQVRRARTVGSEQFGQLVTERVSRAEADQRRGRAGREAPGWCYRLWAERDHQGLRAAAPPEILQRELSSLALELAVWGVRDPAALAWLDPPPADALAAARRLLGELGQLDEGGRPTAAGREVVAMGVEPRLGAMLLAARARGRVALRQAARLCALLEEGDVLVGRRDAAGSASVEIGLRLDRLDAARTDRRLDMPTAGELHEARRQRIIARAAVIERRATGGTERRATGGTERRATGGTERDRGSTTLADERRDLAATMLAGMADRLGQARPDGGGRFVLRGGTGVRLEPDDPLAREPFIVVADATSGPAKPAGASTGAAVSGADLVVRLASAVPAALLPRGERRLIVRWDSSVGDGGDVTVRSEERVGALVVRAGPLNPSEVPVAELTPALLEGVRRTALGCLAMSGRVEALRHRVAFCRRHLGPAEWPDLSDAALLADLEGWLAPYLSGARRRKDLAALDLWGPLWAQLGPGARQAIDRLAPARMDLPTGRSVDIDYAGERPSVAVKLQELFGATSLPPLVDGRDRVVAHLLSPAGRPVAVTDDLARFWAGAYRQVRAELRGRYPKHPWPEDPLTATPTAKTRRRSP